MPFNFAKQKGYKRRCRIIEKKKTQIPTDWVDSGNMEKIFNEKKIADCVFDAFRKIRKDRGSVQKNQC